ncbi:MAG: hypothetical protein EXR71_12940 [Myxococcales bacterium]|nr:hypothetical protein [Myxococcales bacterium]
MIPFLFLFAAAIAGELTVSSNLDGLTIVLNGEDTGKTTPAVLRNVKAGRVTVLVGDLCRAGEATVDLREDEAREVEVFAEEQLAMLTVLVRPAQATLDVNGGVVRISPNVPVGLPCGTYEVSAKLKGYATASYSLELIGGQELELPIELEKLGTSTVEFSVTPRAGTLYFDDREVGQDAASLPSVFEGRHTIGARAKGYNDVEATVEVGGGDGLVFRIKLGRGDDAGTIVAVGAAGKAALASGARGPGEPEEDGDAPEEEPAEPDEDLAPPKSWSERHAAETQPTGRAAPDEGLDGATVPANPKAGVRIAGGVLAGVGAAVAGGGIYAWMEAQDAYGTWSDMNAAAADATSEPDQRRLQSAADTYYTKEFAPRGNLMIGLFAGGGVLVATGVVLFLVDGSGAPVILPAPGGGLLGWAGSF